MLDVVFNLIVFFMVGTKFVEMDRSIDVDVPKVSTAGSVADAPVRRTVGITKQGEITFEGAPLTANELTARLQKLRTEHPQLAVLVKGDGEGKFQTVADVLSACSAAGVADTSICVQLNREVPQRR